MAKKIIETPKTEEELCNEAEILGIILGDGTIHNTKSHIRLQVREKDFAENFYQLIKKTYGIEPSFKKYKYYCVYVHSVTLCKRIIELTLNNKKIPEHIFHGNEQIKARFVRGFADSEGCVENMYHRRQIVLTQKNLDTLNGIQKLLFDIGINSQIYEKKFDSNKLIISLIKNLTIYNEKIGFSIKYKQEKLEDILKELNKFSTFDEELYWKVLEYEITRKESLRKAAKKYNICVEKYRSWISGKKVPNQIKQNLKQKIVPNKYETLQEQYSFLPIIPY